MENGKKRKGKIKKAKNLKITNARFVPAFWPLYNNPDPRIFYMLCSIFLFTRRKAR